jgi:hypothetical protein
MQKRSPNQSLLGPFTLLHAASKIMHRIRIYHISPLNTSRTLVRHNHLIFLDKARWPPIIKSVIIHHISCLPLTPPLHFLVPVTNQYHGGSLAAHSPENGHCVSPRSHPPLAGLRETKILELYYTVQLYLVLPCHPQNPHLPFG